MVLSPFKLSPSFPSLRLAPESGELRIKDLAAQHQVSRRPPKENKMSVDSLEMVCSDPYFQSKITIGMFGPSLMGGP